MGFPMEVSWKKAADRKLIEFYKLETPKDPNLIPGIDRFYKVDFRTRMFEAIGHKYVKELQHRLTVRSDTKRMTRGEWKKFLEVPESTLSHWNHDRHLAGAQNYFAVHHLKLNLPVGAVSFPSPESMFSESIVCLLRHIRFKYLNIDEPVRLEAATVDHVMNLMKILEGDEKLVYNPYGNEFQKTNRSGLRKYADALYRRRYGPKLATYSEASIESGIEALTEEAKVWLDLWGLPYMLFALGYRKDWKKIGRESQ
ncbi:MAG: hypothetical protein U0798_06860 [Gemmataceae bacterium]